MSRTILIKALPNLSKIIVEKDQGTSTRIPNTTFKLRGPFLDPITGMLAVRLDLLDYDALGFSTIKPDSEAIISLKGYVEKQRLAESEVKAKELSEISAKLKTKKTEFDKYNNLLNQYKSKLIDLNTEKLQLENDKKSTKSISTKITTVTKDINLSEGNIEQLRRQISDLKIDLEIAEQNLNEESEIVKKGLENLKRLHSENKKSENELQQELARSLGGKTLSLDPNNTFWKTFPLISLNDDDMSFNMGNSIEALKFCILMGTNWVADNNSREAISKCRNAQYYIYDDEQEDLRKLEETNLVDRANTLRQQMDLETMKAVLELNGEPAYSLSENKIRVKIAELMKKNYRSFVEAAQMDNTELKKKAFVKTLLNTKVLRRRADGKIIYGDIESGRDIGSGVDQAVRYLYAPSNANFRKKLKKVLDTKIVTGSVNLAYS